MTAIIFCRYDDYLENVCYVISTQVKSRSLAKQKEQHTEQALICAAKMNNIRNIVLFSIVGKLNEYSFTQII